jgi:hypothetical protein
MRDDKMTDKTSDKTSDKMTMTHEQIMAMTPEELRLEIARVLGYYQIGHDWPNDIADAWELVEEMGHNCKVHVSYYQSLNKWYCATMREQEVITAKDTTAPLAICRAYLKWKEGAK